MHSRQVLPLFGVELCCCRTRRRAPPQAPQTPPSVTFQVEVNYVDVDAIVTDEQRQLRHRADARRLRGLRGRQAAESRDVFVRRTAGRTRRIDSSCWAVRSAADARSNDGRSMDASTSSCWTISTSARCAHRIVKKSAREFVERAFRRQRPRRRRLYERPHRCDAGLHERSAAAVWRRSTSSSAAGSNRRPSKRSSSTTTGSSPRRDRQDNDVDTGHRHQDTGRRPSACSISSASSVRSRCSTRSAISASSSRASGAGGRPCCSSAKGSKCR